MIREELLGLLARLRQARVEGIRAPHKPLLLLWLFGRFAATGTSLATYEQAEEPVSQLINEFGPPVASPAAARQRAAMPFVHLERELWDLRDGLGREIGPDAPERRGWLLDRGAVGRLRPEVERLLADDGTLAAAAGPGGAGAYRGPAHSRLRPVCRPQRRGPSSRRAGRTALAGVASRPAGGGHCLRWPASVLLARSWHFPSIPAVYSGEHAVRPRGRG